MKITKNKKAKYIVSAGLIIAITLMGLTYYKKYNLKKLNSLSSVNDLNFTSDGVENELVDYPKVQKIFNSRCIACHSCYESPCQLNLQSYEGIQRGVLEDDIFNRYRIKEVPATRLFEDASQIKDWRSLGFHDVIGNQNSSILLSAIRRGSLAHRSEIPNHYPDDRQCINHETSDLEDKMKDPRLAMPFNLPGLSQADVLTIARWIKGGAKGPHEEDLNKINFQAAEFKIIKEWESFLNHSIHETNKQNQYKYQLTSRYLYEHLYLAHLFVKSQPRVFYSLIRSKTSCDNPEAIRTRTPGTDPGLKNFYYCFIKFPGTIVNKNHLPYEISLQKLDWIKQLFIEPVWKEMSDNPTSPPYQAASIESGAPGLEINKIDFKKLTLKTDQLNLENLKKNFEELPNKWNGIIENYKKEKSETEEQIAQNKIASNPFIVFKDIPQESRYRFLLEDAYYHIMTFMKGTVCNGTLSVNAVQDQFFVFFLSPEANKKLITPEVLKEYSFPARYGEETGFKIISALTQQAENRNKSRVELNINLKKYYERGLPLEAIWDGDRENKKNNQILTPSNNNAVLTIFRHNDSASIVRGPAGDLPKTAFVMDYATFERMAYNLVINFDVFGSLGHMMLTRAYMDLIRTDAENLYLSFLPTKQRFKLKKHWYNDSKSKSDIGKIEKDSLNIIMRTLLEKAKLTQTQMEVFYREGELTDIDQNRIPFKESYEKPELAHLDLIKEILFHRLSPETIGKEDALNWFKLKSVKPKNEIEKKLSELTREVKNQKIPFLHHFPELSMLVLGSSDIEGRKHYHQFYSLLLNRQFNSISLMAGEDFRRMPEEESLSLFPKVIGYYPNQFFYVEDSQDAVNLFVDRALSIKTFDDYKQFLDIYGINRMNPEIWNIYDYIVAQYQVQDPVDAGYLDLSRYNFTFTDESLWDLTNSIKR